MVSVAYPKLCAFCDTGIRKCTPTASLRHMIKCEHCSESTCRHLAISEHLFSFKMAPLVGSPDCCCWCGIPWNECGKVAETGLSQSLSPDARSKHKKLCHTTVHESLQSTDPETVLKAKTTLDRIWKETGDKFNICMRTCIRAHYAHIRARVMNSTNASKMIWAIWALPVIQLLPNIRNVFENMTDRHVDIALSPQE